MKWYLNLRIGIKLLSSFIILALISGIIGYVGITQINKIAQSDVSLYENMTVPTAQIGTISTLFQRMRVNTRESMLSSDLNEAETFFAKYYSYRDQIDRLIPQFESSILSDSMRTNFNLFKSDYSTYLNEVEKVFKLIKQNKNAEATDAIRENGVAGKASRALQDQIEKLVNMKVADAKAMSSSNTSVANKASTITIFTLAFGVLLAIGMGILLTLIISRPLNKGVKMMTEMSKGHLGTRIKIQSKDEIGQLAQSMDHFADVLQEHFIAVLQKMAKGDLSTEIVPQDKDDEIAPAMRDITYALRELINEMNQMSEQHDQGDIDVHVAEGKFEGAYKVMAQGVNKMVNGHIDVTKKAMSCVAEFGRGNFDATLERFPGKKAFINENIETLRKNLKDVHSEIGALVLAAIDGKLSTRANASKFEGDWKKLAESLNSLLDAVIAPVQEAAQVLDKMSQGNLNVSVTGTYKGDHAVIKNALNDTIESVSSYIKDISGILNEIANGNLEVEATGDYKGDFIEIKTSLNHIIHSLNEVLSEINVSSDQVASGTRQVSESSQAWSQGSTEQASSIEELTASITQIAVQTKQNAANATTASDLSGTAKDHAIRGNQQMAEMLSSMADISDSSNNISKIIKVIDDIAFQTNMLALNAAVEAARAGQHGKGFAVVAAEVRNLAARSANAAKETTALIEGSIDKVERGTRIANETADALNMIVDFTEQSATLVGEIASASNEQATAIAQINKGIDQVSTVVQSSSATAEESAAASEELSGQAELLKELVSKFRLKKFGRGENRSQTIEYVHRAQPEARVGKAISLGDGFGKY